MPLVVPGINNTKASTDPKDEWMNKLAGKKLSDSATDTTVSPPFPSSPLPSFYLSTCYSYLAPTHSGEPLNSHTSNSFRTLLMLGAKTDLSLYRISPRGIYPRSIGSWRRGRCLRRTLIRIGE